MDHLPVIAGKNTNPVFDVRINLDNRSEWILLIGHLLDLRFLLFVIGFAHTNGFEPIFLFGVIAIIQYL